MSEQTRASFYVIGDPVPQGSMRKANHGGVIAGNDKTLRPWRENIAVSVAAQLWAPGRSGPIFGQHHPVVLSACFTIKAPGYAVKATTPQTPSKKPDMDKLLRALFDGITQAVRGGHRVLWHDDAQCVRLGDVEKTYPSTVAGASANAMAQPGVKVTVKSAVPRG